jgi:hypothetical protein
VLYCNTASYSTLQSKLFIYCFIQIFKYLFIVLQLVLIFLLLFFYIKLSCKSPSTQCLYSFLLFLLLHYFLCCRLLLLLPFLLFFFSFFIFLFIELYCKSPSIQQRKWVSDIENISTCIFGEIRIAKLSLSEAYLPYSKLYFSLSLKLILLFFRLAYLV